MLRRLGVLKDGQYRDFEWRKQLLDLTRFRTTASGQGWRSLKDYVGNLKENQTAISYVTGSDLTRLESSPQLEGFRARGIEVLLLPDAVDSFWVTAGVDYEGKPFKSVTQGAVDLTLIPLLEPKREVAPQVALGRLMNCYVEHRHGPALGQPWIQGPSMNTVLDNVTSAFVRPKDELLRQPNSRGTLGQSRRRRRAARTFRGIQAGIP
jgi:hypothetical protein